MVETVSLKCAQCGHTFTCAAGGAGPSVHCPVCDAEVSLPRGEGEEENTEPRLRVLRHGTAGGKTVVCASCRATLSQGDRVCSQCGAVQPDANAEPSGGPKNKPDPEPRARPAPGRPRSRSKTGKRIPLFWILLVLGAGAYWWWAQSTPPDTPPAETPDPGARLAEARERVRHEWDRDQPMAEPGDDVVWEHQTGRVLRGRLIRRDDSSAEVRTEQGPETVAFNELRPVSRIRIDPEYRAIRIEEEAARRAR